MIMNYTDFDPAEAGKVFTGSIDQAIAQIRADAPGVEQDLEDSNVIQFPREFDRDAMLTR
jgi:hypothetical protein